MLSYVRPLVPMLAALTLAVVLFAGSVSAASAHHRPDHTANCHAQACEIPEVPYAAFLPLAGLAVIGGYYLIDRHRRVVVPEA